MEDIIYTTYQGSDCLISCLYNYLRNHEFLIMESDIFLLGQGWRLSYIKKINGEIIDLQIQSEVMESVKRFCDRVKIMLIYDNYDNCDDAFDNLLSNVSNNIPVIACVDPGYLKYNSVLRDAYGISHYIIVTKVCQEFVCISDGYVSSVPATIFQGKIDAGEFKKAWGSKHYRSIRIDEESLGYLRENFSFEVNDSTIIDAIKSGIIQFLQGGINGDYYMGVDALYQIKNDLNDLYSNYHNAPEAYKKILLELNNHIRIWGLLTSRVLIRNKLSDLVEKGVIKDNNYIIDMDNIIKEWNKMGFMIIKASLSMRKIDLDYVVAKLNSIIDYEKEYFGRLLMQLEDRDINKI